MEGLLDGTFSLIQASFVKKKKHFLVPVTKSSILLDKEDTFKRYATMALYWHWTTQSIKCSIK